MLKNIILILCISILVALGCTKLTQKYNYDITQNHANSLNEFGRFIIDTLEEPVTITVYSTDMNILNTTETILDFFKHYSSKVKVVLTQKILEPKQAGKLKLVTQNNIVVEYKGAQQAMDIRFGEFSQQQISLLIQQTVNHANNWLVFLTGHNEADPLNTAEDGLSSFAQMFVKQGMHFTTLNLAEQKFIPNNTAVLIIINPQQDFLPIEKTLLHQYLQDGGNIIWFTEPEAPVTAFLTEEFGLKPSKGVAVDLKSLELGSPHPAIKIITKFSNNAITNDMQSAILMPWSAHLQQLYQANDWETKPILNTAADTWTYNGPATQDLQILKKYKEFKGPLTLGFALARENTHTNKQQRAIVLADSSFLLNKYLPLYANAQLVNNIVAWAQHDTQVLLYAAPPLRDLSYNPSKYDRFMYTYFFTLIFPALLIAFGIYHTRRV